jgi:hypothetical protein
MKITLKSWSAGDWYELSVEGRPDLEHAGHSIPDFVWLELLRNLGVSVVEEEVSSDDDDY